MNLIARVLFLLGRSGADIGELAEKIGQSPDYVRSRLARRSTFTSLDVARLAITFGVTVEWLLTGENEPAFRVHANSTCPSEALEGDGSWGRCTRSGLHSMHRTSSGLEWGMTG